MKKAKRCCSKRYLKMSQSFEMVYFIQFPMASMNSDFNKFPFNGGLIHIEMNEIQFQILWLLYYFSKIFSTQFMCAVGMLANCSHSRRISVWEPAWVLLLLLYLIKYINCMCMKFDMNCVFICSSCFLFYFIIVIVFFFLCFGCYFECRILILRRNKNSNAPSHPHIQPYIYIIHFPTVSTLLLGTLQHYVQWPWSKRSST